MWGSVDIGRDIRNRIAAFDTALLGNIRKPSQQDVVLGFFYRFLEDVLLPSNETKDANENHNLKEINPRKWVQDNKHKQSEMNAVCRDALLFALDNTPWQEIAKGHLILPSGLRWVRKELPGGLAAAVITITIPNGVTTIGKLTTVGDSAFANCYKLRKVAMPSGVVDYNGAFSDNVIIQIDYWPSVVRSVPISLAVLAVYFML